MPDVSPGAPFSPDLRLSQQMAFLAELDKLKEVLRRSRIAGSLRQENSAEHSWHLAMMSLVLLEHVSLAGLDRFRVVKMLLVHDIVEIDAGDTFAYDTTGNASKAEREIAAADRIFPLLPADQAGELRGLWDEFEAGATPEARVAQGLDRMQSVLQNLNTNGASWRQHGITKAQVLALNQKIGDTMPEIWAALLPQFDLAEERGLFSGETELRN